VSGSGDFSCGVAGVADTSFLGSLAAGGDLSERRPAVATRIVEGDNPVGVFDRGAF